ncbi:hypothetical protein C8F04DRAFT_1198759, partial [Mycena alexandri]
MADADMDGPASHSNNGQNHKKQAVPGPERGQIESLQSDVALYREREAALHKEFKTSRIRVQNLEREIHKLKGEQALALHHYQGQLDNLQRQLAQKETALHQTTEHVETLNENIERLESQHQVLSHHDAEMVQLHQKQQVQLAAAEQALEARNVQHAKEMAAKTSEIMSLMSKLRTQAPAAPPADTNFPLGPPILVPRFLSEGKRKTRLEAKVLKTPRAGVPILPLAVASGNIPEEAVNYDPKEPSPGPQGKPPGRRQSAPRGLKNSSKNDAQEDELYKRGMRETWRNTFETSCADDFQGYEPISQDRVEACRTGGAGPALGEYTLDFGEGYQTSLWNKKIIARIGLFPRRREASGNGWGLPPVSRVYVEEQFAGQLKRSQQAWALWQPRFMQTELRYETSAEATARAQAYVAHRMSRVNANSSKNR